MEKLSKGITGFWKIGQRRPPSTDKFLLERVVKKIQSSALFRTVVLSEPNVDNNFYVISLFSDIKKHCIGINASFPIYCGIKNMSDWTTIEFYDLPDALTDILNHDFMELKSNFLNRALKKEHLTLLGKVELEQIEYWEAEKIGNVIFNTYD